MEYALEYADKPETFWDRVVFCDEKTFSTDDPAAAQYVWRTPRTRLRPSPNNVVCCSYAVFVIKSLPP